MTLYRDMNARWGWRIGNYRCEAGPWVRIESAVANLEQVLGVQTEWVKPARGWRTLIVTGRPIDVEIKR